MTEAGATKTFNYWHEALKAKYDGQGRPYGRAEFDKLLGDYSVWYEQARNHPIFANHLRLQLICPAYSLSTNY